jgi:hypothetical protein
MLPLHSSRTFPPSANMPHQVSRAQTRVFESVGLFDEIHILRDDVQNNNQRKAGKAHLQRREEMANATLW